MTEDIRLRRTRDALYAALDALLGERPFSEITISDLTARAKIGRPTFYRHFRDIDAMLVMQLHSDLDAQLGMAGLVFGRQSEQLSLRQVAAFAFERVGQRPELYRLILSGEAGGRAQSLFRDQVGALLALQPELAGEVTGDPKFASYAYSFYAGAIGAVLLRWIDNGRTPGAQAMGEMFAKLVVTNGNAGG
jgi:AcrR family transcriptional regulator